MLKPIYRTLSILASLSFSLSAFAGAGSSVGGADSASPSAGAAWFIGQGKQIKACIQVASDFGMPKDTVPQTMIQTVFKNWQAYVQDKQIEKTRDAKLKLVFDLNFNPTCDGSEDLTFFFGVDNTDTARAKAEFNDPVAFAYRQTFDDAKGWGKGFIWVQKAPVGASEELWQSPARLQTILMHEVGHVLGCDHVSGTVMDSNIAEFIRSDASLTSSNGPGAEQERADGQRRMDYFSKHIDGSNLLYWCIECTTQVAGQIGIPKRFEPSHGFDPKITFTRFVGRAPVGKIEATFQMELNENDDQHLFKSLSLVYRDQRGSKTIPFMMRKSANSFDQSNNAFVFSVYTSSDPHGGTGSPPAIGAVMEGYVRDASNKLLPITIAVNSTTNYSWVQIDYVVGLTDLPLFRAISASDWYDRR